MNQQDDQIKYILTLSVIRRTLLDALNGYGLETLAALFYPAPQSAISLMLEVDADVALQRTMSACQTLIALDDDKQQAVRHALTWMSPGQLETTLSEVI